jgi:hypothetical protein
LPHRGAELGHGRTPRTISIASFWQAWHSKVRNSQPGLSGPIRVSNIVAPHLGHVGCTMSGKCETDWTWRMATPAAVAGAGVRSFYHRRLTHLRSIMLKGTPRRGHGSVRYPTQIWITASGSPLMTQIGHPQSGLQMSNAEGKRTLVCECSQREH